MLKINNVAFTARLTRDAEVKYLPSGQELMLLGCAINNSYKKNDQWVDATVFLDVDVWGKYADTLAQTGKMVKGAAVYVEGSLKQDSWEKDGQKQTKIKVTARTVSSVETGKAGDAPTKAPATKPTAPSDSLDFDDDDPANRIPF